MSDLTIVNTSANVSIITTQQKQETMPKWFSEVILLTNLWVKVTSLLSEMNKRVKLSRGRMGEYEVLDFVLILLTYTISNERSLSLFFRTICPISAAIAALWERKKIASASALSRFLKDVTSQCKPYEVFFLMIY